MSLGVTLPPVEMVQPQEDSVWTLTCTVEAKNEHDELIRGRDRARPLARVTGVKRCKEDWHRMTQQFVFPAPKTRVFLRDMVDLCVKHDATMVGGERPSGRH